jgi:hypothetical protein
MLFYGYLQASETTLLFQLKNRGFLVIPHNSFEEWGHRLLRLVRSFASFDNLREDLFVDIIHFAQTGITNIAIL